MLQKFPINKTKFVCGTGDFPVDDLDFNEDGDATSSGCPPQTHGIDAPPIVNLDDGEVEPFEDLEFGALCYVQLNAHAVLFMNGSIRSVSTGNHDFVSTRPTTEMETITSKRFIFVYLCVIMLSRLELKYEQATMESTLYRVLPRRR